MPNVPTVISKIKIQIDNQITTELAPEIRFQRELIKDLKIAIDCCYSEEQIEYVRKTLDRIINNLFTFYEVYEKDLYKKYNIDIDQSYSYNYMKDRKKFWEKYKC